MVDAVRTPRSTCWCGPGAPSVAELARAGVARISIGGAFAYASIAALVGAAKEFHDEGTYGFAKRAGAGAKAARSAFRPLS